MSKTNKTDPARLEALAADAQLTGILKRIPGLLESLALARAAGARTAGAIDCVERAQRELERASVAIQPLIAPPEASIPAPCVYGCDTFHSVDDLCSSCGSDRGVVREYTVLDALRHPVAIFDTLAEATQCIADTLRRCGEQGELALAQEVLRYTILDADRVVSTAPSEVVIERDCEGHLVFHDGDEPEADDRRGPDGLRFVTLGRLFVGIAEAADTASRPAEVEAILIRATATLERAQFALSVRLCRASDVATQWDLRDAYDLVARFAHAGQARLRDLTVTDSDRAGWAGSQCQ